MNNSKKFLKSIGIKSYKPWKSFWGGLKKRYGEAAENLYEVMCSREDGDFEKKELDVYKIKNSSLDLSLEVSSQYYSEIYKHYLDWFITSNFEKPKRLIDLACDNGVLTCFYATLYPESEVIGIDSCQEAIICAKQLAERLGINNVKFENKNLGDSAYLESLGEFDIVTATTAFNEFLGDLKFGTEEIKSRHFNLEEAGLKMNSSDVLTLLFPITRMVRLETGSFITMDRWSSIGGLCWWAFALNKANISLDFTRSFQIDFKNTDGDEEKFPLLVGIRLKEAQEVQSRDVLSFYNYFTIESKRDQYKYEGPIAESLFFAINPKSRLASYEFEYLNGSGTRKIELWATDSLLLLYDYSNQDYRCLTVHSLLVLGNTIEFLDDLIQKLKPDTKFNENEDLSAIQEIFNRISAQRIRVDAKP